MRAFTKTKTGIKMVAGRVNYVVRPLAKKLFSQNLVFILVALSLILQPLPPLLEKAIASSELNNADSGRQTALDNSSPYTENTSKRDRSTKYFEDGNGNGYAIFNMGSLHYQDTNDEWQDIDNNLEHVDANLEPLDNNSSMSRFSSGSLLNSIGRMSSMSGGGGGSPTPTPSPTVYPSATATMAVTATPTITPTITPTPPPDTYYVNKGNAYRSIFKDNSSGYFEKVVLGDKTIEFGVAGATTVTPEVENNHLTYKNILSGVDVEYLALSDSVKENIILNDVPTISSVNFNLRLSSNLHLVTTTEGDIKVLDSNDNFVWNINRPNVTKGPDNVIVYGQYNLTNLGQDTYTVEMPISQDFLPNPEVGYPLIIDPTLVLIGGNENTYVTDAAPNWSFGDQQKILVGHYEDGISRGYFKFNDLNSLSGANINSAVFAISTYEERASIPRIKAYRPTTDWSGTSLTWNNQPSLDQTAIASAANNISYAWWNFDVTNYVKGIAQSQVGNYGLALIGQDESISRRMFMSKTWPTTDGNPSAFRPYIMVNYNTNTPANTNIGLKNYWKYTTANTALGQFSANVANGNLTYNFQDTTTDARGFDLNLSHTYNSQDSYNGRYGYNWSISANKRLIVSTDKSIVQYIDETGTPYTFYDTDGNGNYVDEDGTTENKFSDSSGFYRLHDHRPNGLTWSLKYSASTAHFIAKAVGNITYTFDSDGKILSETDKNGNTLGYEYDLGGKLASIIDASGDHRIRLYYDNDGYLQRIEDPNYQSTEYHSVGGKVVYTYDNSNLKTISFYTGDTLIGTDTFNYSGHQLTSFVDALNNTTSVGYDNSNRATTLTDALSKATTIAYPEVGHSKVTSAKGNETGADPTKYTTDYYYHSSAYFLPDIIYKEIGPEIKDQNNNTIHQTYEYDYNDDFLLAATTDPTGAVKASAYNDVNGLLVYEYNELKNITQKNSYNHSDYNSADWRLVDSYDANGSQTMFYYDTVGNLTRKSVADGNAVNLLHNPGFESATRVSDGYDNNCPDGTKKVGIADYWCGSGSKMGNNQIYGVDATTQTDGLQSQYIGFNNSGAATSVNVFQDTDEILATEPNTDYTLTWKYKKQTSNTNFYVEMAINYYNTVNQQIGNTILISTTNATDWTQQSYTFHTPTDYNGHPFWTTEVFMRAKATTTGVTEKAWFDSVKINKGSTVSNQTEKYTTIAYNQYGNPTSETTPENKTTAYTWDNYGNLLTTTDPLSNVSSYTYDPNGNKLTKVEPRGNATQNDPNDFKTIYTYNGLNKITSVKEAKTNDTTNYTYNAVGNLLTTETPSGLTTTYTYDANNRPKETTNPYGFKSAVQYDANGNPEGVTDPNSNKSSTSYDPSDRVTQDTDPTGKQTDYKYDNTDNLKTVSEDSKTLAYNYDKEGKVLSEANNQLGDKTISYTYDKEGNLTVVNPQTGETVNTTYSTTNEVSKVTVNSLTTTYTRNKNNQLTQLDKPNADQLKLTYNNNAQVTNFSNEKNSQTILGQTYEYDANGNKTSITTTNSDNSTSTTTYEYDNQNQLTAIHYPDTTSKYFVYNNAGNITSSYIGSNTTSFDYKGNRLITKQNPDNSKEYYGYDANGNVTSRDTADRINLLLHTNDNLNNERDKIAQKLPDGQTAQYVTGKFGNALNVGSTGYLPVNSSSDFVNKFGSVEFYYKPNWTSNNQNRVLFEYYYSDNYYFRLTLDSSNHLVFVRKYFTTDLGTYTTDPVTILSDWNHIALVFCNNRSTIYLNGSEVAENIISTISNPNSPPNLYYAPIDSPQYFHFGASKIGTTASGFADGAFDELLTTDVVKTDSQISTDAQATSEATLTHTTVYQYDSGDYLNKVTKPDGTVITYTYDSSKRLVKRAVTGQDDTNYQYDGDKITTELKNDNTVLRKYFYDSNGAILYIDISGTKYYPIFDGLGSITALRDSSGTTVATYTYDEWGKLLNKTGTIDSPIRFASYWYDDSVNLYHLGARWYDPTLYRFISVDPHPGDQDDALSLNEYLYTANNPILRTDPDGDRWNITGPFSDWLYRKGYGDAANYLYNNNKGWKFAMDHPIITGAAVGIAAGLTAYAVSSGIEYGVYRSTLNNPNVPKNLLKQSSKQLTKQIKSQAKVIAEHATKIKNNPRSININHWKNEIKAARKIIKYSKKLVRFAK